MPLTRLEKIRLAECSTEPIRTPGTIQPHGVLLAVDRESREIVVASENTLEFFGRPAADVLGYTVGDLVGDEVIPALREAVNGSNPTTVIVNDRPFDAIVHPDGPLAFVEFEPRLDDSDRDAVSATYAAAHRLSAIADRETLLAAITAEFSRLTGFDRVMVYHFHADGHGEIVAETAQPDMEPYLGLHFPASDIPDQARALYLTKLSRAIVSAVTPPVTLVGLPGTSAPDLDLTHAELRSVSPFHLQFMRNMGQASTVSFSLIYQGELIGMITCAHRTERRLPFLMRRSLEVLSNQLSLQLGSMHELARLGRELSAHDLRTRLLGKIVASDDIAGALLTGDFTVLDVIGADAAVLRLDGVLTRTADAPQLDSLASLAPAHGVFVSGSIAVDLPEHAEELAPFAGILVVRIGTRGDYLAFLREEVVQSIDWLGDLTEQNRAERLSPRTSFSAWRQSVTGTSLPWGNVTTSGELLAADVEAALHRREESRLATLAMHDPLTGLANRRALLSALELVEQRAGAHSLLFIDLDNFKSINDTHGHEAGDDVLVETARRLVEHTRADDRVARLGGDEFVVFVPHTKAEVANALAERIATAIRSPIGVAEHTVTASIGIVEVGPDLSPDEMLGAADAAMYRAKQAGRDGVSR